MPAFPKKRVRHGVARIAVAIIYLFITFTISLTHTCNLYKADPRACHSNSAYHCWSFESHTCTQLKIALFQNSFKTKVLTHHGPCMACLYSITSRTVQVIPGPSLVNTKLLTSVRALHDSLVTKQFEWTSSIVLRAPPVSIS